MRRWVALVAALLASSAAGQVARDVAVTSAAPERVAVTVYRNPDRQRGQTLDLRWLGGFALVTETRRVRVPRGRAVLRFEGVSGGIVPASAVIVGLPGGVIEKNRDARLLSPAALVDGTLGGRVTIRRTDRASGRGTVEDAEVVAGPAGGVVLRTRAGIEALRCSGLAETPLYDGVPTGLSARPVLSVTTDSARAGTATVTLSYLASGFDWGASYVATVAGDGRTLDLHAWMTLANGSAEGFANAEVRAVAGRLNRREMRELEGAVGALRLSCYPLGTTTSDLRRSEMGDREIVVTGSRTVAGEMSFFAAPPAPVSAPPPPENLGDLKLYRVPFRVNVAANAQKQVALLAAAKVPFERVYRAAVGRGAQVADAPTRIALRVRNEVAGGLGIALPEGTTALYAERGGGGGRLLLGTGTVRDAAVGERMRIEAGTSSQVLVAQADGADGAATLVVSNANGVPATVEVTIGGAGDAPLRAPSMGVERIDGMWTWIVAVPANGRAELHYGG